MASTVLIMGESGTGKSTAIRTLNPKDTAIIRVVDKPLPFREWKKNYHPINKDGGNLYTGDGWENIIKTMNYLADKRPDIKNIVVDDFQYIMANEFMRRSGEKGYEKFTQIADHAWRIIYLGGQLSREDMTVFFLSHSETDEFGKTRLKTIGKMLHEKICLEGLFTVVLHSAIEDGNYYLYTQSTESITAKSPMGMFDDLKIPNDLEYVNQKIKEYEQ